MKEKEILVEFLKERIFEIESSYRDKDPKQRITTVTISGTNFLKMAYLYVGTNNQ